MGFRAITREFVEKISGRKIYKRLPFGVNPFEDLLSCFPDYEFKVIFDVGANIGQSAKPFSSRFPLSRIYCFEPVFSTFSELKQNLKACKNIEFFQMALGSKKGEMPMIPRQSSDRNSLKGGDDQANGIRGDVEMEMICISTLADFCPDHRIGHIDYLKVDTEGYDLEVLKGAGTMLENSHISFIELEAGMNPGNTFHVPFEEIKHYLEGKGYYLFGIYEQVQEWMEKRPVLRRSNPLFISPKLANP